jgi:hypothetical protein
MAPESMVHALEMIYDLLEDHGDLIDVHPSIDPPVINVINESSSVFAGYLRENDDYIEYTQADQALASVINSGLYVIKKQDLFNFSIYSDTLDEFLAYLAENWSDAYLENDTIDRIRKQMSLAEGYKLVSTEKIKIARLGRL